MSQPSLNVLVVEDEPVVARDIVKRVQSYGFGQPAVAHNGAQAIRYAKQAEPDVIIMDISLGSGKDGIETARYLREKYDFSLVYLTALLDVERAKDTNPDAYIIKPFNDGELKQALNSVLQKKLQTTSVIETEATAWADAVNLGLKTMRAGEWLLNNIIFELADASAAVQRRWRDLGADSKVLKTTAENLQLGPVAFGDYNSPLSFAAFSALNRTRLAKSLVWFDIHRFVAAHDPIERSRQFQLRLADEIKHVRAVFPTSQIELPDSLPDSNLANQATVAIALQHPRFEKRFRSRVYRALWQQGLDIGDLAVLEELALDCGIPDLEGLIVNYRRDIERLLLSRQTLWEQERGLVPLLKLQDGKRLSGLSEISAFAKSHYLH